MCSYFVGLIVLVGGFHAWKRERDEYAQLRAKNHLTHDEKVRLYEIEYSRGRRR